MHSDILSIEQKTLLSWAKQFKREFYLVGGTAISLYLGHRKSIDFDLFKLKPVVPNKCMKAVAESGFPYSVLFRDTDQIHFMVNGVKVTFFQYPYAIEAKQDVDGVFRVPALLDLAAMKAYALGRRSKWKDYVDLYFLLKGHFTIEQISIRATEIFGEMFSEKLFRAQLCYFDGVDYTEKVDWLIPNPPTDDEIRAGLVEIAAKL